MLGQGQVLKGLPSDFGSRSNRMIKYLNRALKVKRFCRFLQYQRRGIGELVLKDQHQLVLKYQQATPLELAGMPLRLGLMEDCFTVISYNS